LAMDKAYTELASRLKQAYGSKLKSVVLFGSHARGEARLESDRDILLIIEDVERNALKRMRRLRSLVLDMPVQFSFVAKSPEEIAENLTPLLLDICVDGKVIHDDGFFEVYRKKGLEALGQAKMRRRRVGRELCWQFERIPRKEWELTWDGYREFT
jgi:predicted nucleotidyltransferase